MDIWTLIWTWIAIVVVVNIWLAFEVRSAPTIELSGEGETFRDWLNELEGKPNAQRAPRS